MEEKCKERQLSKGQCGCKRSIYQYQFSGKVWTKELWAFSEYKGSLIKEELDDLEIGSEVAIPTSNSKNDPLIVQK